MAATTTDAPQSITSASFWRDAFRGLKHRSAGGELLQAGPSAPHSERTTDAPIRRRLMLLILSLVIPGLVYNAVVTMQFARTDQQRVRDRGAGVARELTQGFDLLVARHLLVLEGLARTLAEQEGRPEAIETTLRTFANVTSTRISLLDLAGRPLRADHPGSKQNSPTVGWSLLAEVMASRAPVVGNFVSPAVAGGKAGVALAAPVIIRGEVIAIVAGVVDIDALKAVFDYVHLDPSWRAALVDRDGIVIARRPISEPYIGTLANPSLLNGIGGHSHGIIENYITRESTKGIGVFRRSDHTGWTVGFAIPESQLSAPLEAAMFRTMILGVSLLVLSMALATWGGLLVERPIRRLHSAAVALGRGERIELQPTGITELDEVGRAFLEAAAERKRSESKLIASEEFARSVLDSSPDSVKVLDLDGTPVYLNARARAERDMAAGDEGNTEAWSRLCPDGFAETAAIAIESAKRGHKYEFACSQAGWDGNQHWWDVTVTPVTGADGSVVRILTVSRDVTERRNFETALIASEAFNRSIVQNTTDCVKLLELDSSIAYMNENGQRAIEADSFADVEGKRWVQFWPEESAPLASDAVAAAAAGEHAAFSAACPTFKGHWRWWDNTITPIFDNDGNVARLLAVSRDVSERKRSEERQALLVRELAHRSKNLLAVVQSIALQSLKDAADETARAAFIARLHTLGRSHAMVSLDVHEGAPLTEIVRRELDAFAGTATIDGPDLIVSRKTAQNLALAVHELATNAAKYGALKSPGGTIAVRWRLVGSGETCRFVFNWLERGGPAPVPPSSKGFGSLLLDRVVASELRAATKADFGPLGLSYEIDAPLAEIAAEFTPQDGLVVPLQASQAA